jgi:hypothetical protein
MNADERPRIREGTETIEQRLFHLRSFAFICGFKALLTRPGRALAAVIAFALFAPGAPAAAQTPGGLSATGETSTGRDTHAAVPTLTLPPSLRERERSNFTYSRWQAIALQDTTPPPPADAPPPGVEPGTRPLEFTADRIETPPGEERVILRGHVRVLYREYELTADEATIDTEGRVAEFRGAVVLRGPERTVSGDALHLDLRTRAWELRRARTAITPESVEQGLLGPVFLQAQIVAGKPGELSALQGAFTTCDLPRPHYEFRARSILVYPGRRLIARGATLYALGHRLLPPQTIALPIREFQRPTYLPEVGRSEAEGTYIKYARPYTLRSIYPGVLKLDLMEKRGFGTGIDQTYRLLGGAGTLLLYNILPRAGVPQETSGRLQHSQQFGSLRVDFGGDFRRSAYQYAVSQGSTTTSITSNLNLSRQVGRSNTTLGINESATSTASGAFSGTFRNLTANLTHNQQFGAGTSGTFGADYLSSDSGGSARNAQLNSRLDMKRTGRSFDLGLMANNTHTISGLGQFAGVDRLPEIALLTDTFRFREGRLAERWPARLQLTLGRYHEEPNNIRTDRALFDLSLNDKRWDWGRSQLDLTAGFRQGFYSDGAAQYVVSDTTRYSYEIGRDSLLSLSHIYQQAQGFTPFRFDFPFAAHRAEALLSLRRAERLGIAFRTAYDFRSKTPIRWQPLTIQAFWKPTSTSLLTLGTSYNIDTFGPLAAGLRQSRFQTVVSELRVRVPNGLKLDVGLRYDPATSRFVAAKSQIDTALGRKWHLAALFGYDGFARFNDFMLIRDLHCWELSIVRTDHRDWRREQSWQIYLRIKAFPAFNRFGVGQSGQGIDTSVGRVY